MKPSISIIHETSDYVIFNKPTGLDSQNSKPDRPSVSGWLEERYAYRGLVHRLDFGTSGIMIAAKTSKSAAHITDLMQKGKITRCYKAIVMGLLENDKGTIEKEVEGKEATSFYKVLERYRNATALEMTLDTGRKHQLRIHLHSIGHPIIGDHLYKKNGSHLLLKRPALHSWKLKFENKEYICAEPEDILTLCTRLKGKS